jgi:hypothetical protein
MIGTCAACDERFVSFCNRPGRRYCSKRCQKWAKSRRVKERQALGLQIVSWLLRRRPDLLAGFIAAIAEDKRARPKGPKALPAIPRPRVVSRELAA